MRTRPAWLAVALLLALALGDRSPAAALTMVLPGDDALTDESTLIVEGTVSAVRFVREPAATDYTVRIDRLLKGIPVEPEVTVRLPGGPAGNGLWLHVPGMPAWGKGDRVLLFAGLRHGRWMPLHFVAGAFRIEPRGAEWVAVRDLVDVKPISLPDRTAPKGSAESERDLALFEQWVADRVAGVERPVDYLVANERRGDESQAQAIRAKFALTPHNDGWLQFARGEEVTWYSYTTVQPELASGGLAEFLTAMAAWNDDPATDIQYTYAGVTDYFGNPEPNFSNPPHPKNVLYLNDPSDWVPPFSCKTGGILGVTLTWTAGPFGGPEPIQEAHIIIGDNVFNCSAITLTTKNAEEIFAHELGHSLGLSHPCQADRYWPCPRGQEPLMRAGVYFDNRGARFALDDRQGIFARYGGDLDAPSDLQAIAVTRAGVTLSWSDNSTVEEVFLVQLKKGRKWNTVATAPQDAMAATVTGLRRNAKVTLRVVAAFGEILATSPELTIRTAR